MMTMTTSSFLPSCEKQKQWSLSPSLVTLLQQRVSWKALKSSRERQPQMSCWSASSCHEEALTKARQISWALLKRSCLLLCIITTCH